MKNKNLITSFDRMPVVLPIDYLKQCIGNLYNNGLPCGLYTGVSNLDNIFRLDRGRLVTVTGVPNYGKSEFVDFLTTTFNKRYGMKTLYFSPENQPVEFHLSKLVRKFTNKPFDKHVLSEKEVEKAVDYIANNFYFFNYQKVSTLQSIKDEAAKTIKEKGIDILVLDAYNKIESEMPSGEIETNFISKVLDGLCDMAIRMNVLVILVAHPKKMEWDSCKGGFKCPNAYDINGSANFFNKSDYVLVVHRDMKADTVNVRVDKVKFSNYGKADFKGAMLKYDIASGNYYNAPDELSYYDEDSADSTYHPDSFTLPEPIMKGEPLDVEVSYYCGTADNVGRVVKLKDVLFSEDGKGVAETIRRGNTPEDRHAIKESMKYKIPCYTIGGTFTKRGIDGLEKASGLIGIDIDYKDNVEIMNKVPDILRSLPYITYYAKSISGDGYFAIIQIDNIDTYKQHFLALESEFADYGIILDKSCKDVSRLRFVSYDEQAYYNSNASVYYYVISDTENVSATQSTPVQYYVTSTNPSKAVETAIQALKASGHTVANDYNTWFSLGMSLSTLGEEGRKYFHTISAMSPQYTEEECDKQYDAILHNYEGKNKFTIGTAIKILKDAI